MCNMSTTMRALPLSDYAYRTRPSRAHRPLSDYAYRTRTSTQTEYSSNQQAAGTRAFCHTAASIMQPCTHSGQVVCQRVPSSFLPGARFLGQLRSSSSVPSNTRFCARFGSAISCKSRANSSSRYLVRESRYLR